MIINNNKNKNKIQTLKQLVGFKWNGWVRRVGAFGPRLSYWRGYFTGEGRRRLLMEREAVKLYGFTALPNGELYKQGGRDGALATVQTQLFNALLHHWEPALLFPASSGVSCVFHYFHNGTCTVPCLIVLLELALFGTNDRVVIRVLHNARYSLTM